MKETMYHGRVFCSNRLRRPRVFQWMLLLIMIITAKSYGQTDAVINLAAVDGIELTPDNLLRFQIQLLVNHPVTAVVEGSIIYKGSNLRINYKFDCTLQPGANLLDPNVIHPQYSFSESALRELFLQYKRLPEGTYQYCVSVTMPSNHHEVGKDTYTDCIYNKSEDIFLINLIDPDNNAKIYEYNPMLVWSVNYPFASLLDYRLRVAPVKQGQNAIAAITRNNLVFDEKHIMQTGLMYPTYAKTLEVNQPYAWTVDAYYKGILLGGAAPWIFTIIEDSVWKHVPIDPSFIDIRKESGRFSLYAPGKIKLMYDLKDYKTDSLNFYIQDLSGNKQALKTNKVAAVYGENRYVIDLYEESSLKHLKQYQFVITDLHGEKYSITFKYVNPDLLDSK